MTAKERVQSEVAELTERLEKLDSFIMENPEFKKLSGIQQGLLVAQSQAMNTYATILGLRLENWED